MGNWEYRVEDILSYRGEPHQPLYFKQLKEKVIPAPQFPCQADGEYLLMKANDFLSYLGEQGWEILSVSQEEQNHILLVLRRPQLVIAAVEEVATVELKEATDVSEISELSPSDTAVANAVVTKTTPDEAAPDKTDLIDRSIIKENKILLSLRHLLMEIDKNTRLTNIMRMVFADDEKDKDKVLNALFQLAISDKDSNIILHATEALNELDLNETLEFFIKNALEGENKDIRERASEILMQLSSEEVLPILIERSLEEDDSEIQNRAVTILSVMDQDKAVELFLNSLNETDDNVRIRAIDALSVIGLEKAIKPLLKIALEDKNKQVRARATTALEIIKDLPDLDYFIVAVGTGGTITGVGTILKQHNPNISIKAIEPKTSSVLSGNNAGKHKIQGVGAGFIPEIGSFRGFTHQSQSNTYKPHSAGKG